MLTGDVRRRRARACGRRLPAAADRRGGHRRSAPWPSASRPRSGGEPTRPERGPGRGPRRREAVGPDLARRRRPRAAPVVDAAGGPRRDARPVRGRRAAACSWAARRASSSTTCGRRSATGRRSASARRPRPTTSTASGRRSTGRRRPARPSRPALAGFTGPHPPGPAAATARSRSRAAARTSWPARGEAVELAPRDVVIHEVDARSSGTTATRRGPIAVVDVACSAGTYIRALARDLGARLGQRGVPRGARPHRVGRVPARGRGRVRVAARARRRTARTGIARRPAARSTPGSRTCPHATITDDEVRRLREGLITAPKRRSQVPRRAARARGRPGRHASPPSAARSRGALHPHKVLAERPRAPAPRARDRLTVHVARGLDGPARVARPAVRRRRRVRRAAPGPRLPARAPRARRRRERGARPIGDHLRPPPRRGPHGLGAAAPVRPGRAPRAAGRGRRRRRRSSSTSTGGCARRRTTAFVAAIADARADRRAS